MQTVHFYNNQYNDIFKKRKRIFLLSNIHCIGYCKSEAFPYVLIAKPEGGWGRGVGAPRRGGGLERAAAKPSAAKPSVPCNHLDRRHVNPPVCEDWMLERNLKKAALINKRPDHIGCGS